MHDGLGDLRCGFVESIVHPVSYVEPTQWLAVGLSNPNDETKRKRFEDDRRGRHDPGRSHTGTLTSTAGTSVVMGGVSFWWRAA